LGAREVQQDFGWRHNSITGADVHLKRDPNISQRGHELDAHAAVLLVLADRFHLNTLCEECQTVLRNIDSAQRHEHALECIRRRVAKAKEVETAASSHFCSAESILHSLDF